MQFVDAAPIAGTRRTADGYLVAEVRTARTGIQDYAGFEVGKPDMPIVKVYRPADQVFSKDSMGSYAHKPVTNDHPAEAVSATNWKDLAVGQIGDEVARDGEFVRIPLVVMDAAAIKLVEDGKRELSAGYVCDLAFEAGVAPDGQAYDAIQKDIRINHVAIVQNGRAGSKARIGDGAISWGVAPVTNDQQPEKEKIMTLKTVTVDGIPVEVTDQGATVIGTLQSRLADANTKFADAEKAHQTAIAAKDAELAKKDAEIDALKAKVLDEKALDAKVQARADLISLAGKIAKDVKTEGLTDAEIRKAVVVAKVGDAAIKGKPEAYIDARFDILADEAKATADPVRGALLNRDTTIKPTDNGQAAYEQRLADAWKPKKEA